MFKGDTQKQSSGFLTQSMRGNLKAIQLAKSANDREKALRAAFDTLSEIEKHLLSLKSPIPTIEGMDQMYKK